MKFANKIIICLMALAIFCCSCTSTPTQSSFEVSNSSAHPVNNTPSEPQLNTESESVSTEAPSSSQINSSEEASSAPPPSSSTSSEQLPPEEITIKHVAFTFDDGPHYIHTKNIVDKFKEYGGACTFFVIGNRIGDQNGAAIKYAVDNGCDIGIHAYTHKHKYNTCTDEIYQQELSNTADAIHNYLPDYNIRLMRPVGGNITKSRIEACEYSVITWNVDSVDWKYKNGSAESATNNIRNNIMKDAKDCSIILMHEIYNNSYEALCILLDEMYQQGYRFVSVSELIGEENLQSGKKYSHG